MADNGVRLLTGTMVDNGAGGLVVNVNGSLLEAGFIAGYVAVEYDVVQVLSVGGTAVVLGAKFTTARPLTGVVTSVAAGLATVTTSVGTIQARYTGTAPSAPDVVRLDWTTAQPWILGKAIPVDPPWAEGEEPQPTKPPRDKPTTGLLTIPAGWSGSWRPSPYSLWQPGDVRQGAYGSGVEYQGLWGGYSQAKLKSLSGKTVTKVQIRVGARLRLGNFNSSIDAKFYRSSTTGKGDPNTANGPYTKTAAPNWGARWITLPDALGDALKSGGTVTLQGTDYAGFEGRSKDASSGALRIYWKD